MAKAQRYQPLLDDHLRLALRHVRAAERQLEPWALPESRALLLVAAEALVELGATPRRRRRTHSVHC